MRRGHWIAIILVALLRLLFAGLIYIIDDRGIIVYRGGLGPFGYHPEEARAWLSAHFNPQVN